MIFLQPNTEQITHLCILLIHAIDFKYDIYDS